MPVRPSIAENLFYEIMEASDQIQHIKAMVNSIPPTVESEYLDFKGANRSAAPIPDGDLKKIWSEALSGFATTSGGVLIWGIDARKNEDGIDQACGFNLVSNPAKLKSRLQELLHQATDPPIPGVRIEAFIDPAENNQGFVVCYIPESDYKPHRTELGGKRWMMRISDSFIDVPPPILRSLFFPHRQSYIFLEIGVKADDIVGKAFGGAIKAKYEFRIYNKGPATASEMMIAIQGIENMTFIPITGWTERQEMTDWHLRKNEPLHAGEGNRVCVGEIRYPVILIEGSPAVGPPDKTVFQVQLYATDQAPVWFHVVFSDDQVRASTVLKAFPVPLEVNRFD